MRNLIITLSGEPGVGKTHALNIIESVLIKHGFKVIDKKQDIKDENIYSYYDQLVLKLDL